ncbi:MAG TPA: hypothetical protein VKV02_08720 [Acidobacteriaceae bacterium]|nr:hypothetical protein [Acidobacteriaceae bacterium]
MRIDDYPVRKAPALLRHAVFLAAFSTYLFDPVDVVWRAVRHSAHPRAYERLCFSLAASLLAVAAIRRHTLVRQQSQLHHERDTRSPVPLGELLFALPIATLLPVSGAFLLLGGIVIQAFLWRHSPDMKETAFTRRRLVYWSAFGAMTLFALSLQDRVAEILFGCTLLLALWADFGASNRRGSPRT